MSVDWGMDERWAGGLLLAVGFVVYVLGAVVRALIFKAGAFGAGLLQEAAHCAEERMGAILVAGIAWVYGCAVAGVILLLGVGEVEAIVGVAVLVTFWVVQSPRLTKPSIGVALLPAEGTGYRDKPQRSVTAAPGREALLFFRITNIGLNFYENCQVLFCFPDGFDIVDDAARYEPLDFSKKFDVERQNRCAIFKPDANYLGLAPGNYIVFPLWVRTPATSNHHAVRVLLSAETRWGEAEKELRVQVR